jgi:putative ABC transport system permease protein
MKKHDLPPDLLLRMFRWYCHPKLLSHIEGDLIELYRERVTTFGKRTADWRFLLDVLFLFRPGIIKSIDSPQLTPKGMYRNYLKVSLRNLAKNKAFSFINISGLSLGLTCSILTALWVHNEYRMDAFHEDADRLYAVTSTYHFGTEVNGSYGTPGLLADELKKMLPEVEYATGQVSWSGWHSFSAGDKKTKLPGNFGSGDFFKMFSHPLVAGNKEMALPNSQSIAISRKMATILFGSPELAIGQGVRHNNERDLKVTAVFEDMSNLSSEKFEFILHWDLFLEKNPWLKDWHNTGPGVFIKLREKADANALASKIQHFVKKYDTQYTTGDHLELALQPYTDKYLHSHFENGKISGGRIEYVRLFEAVALFILVIACINFMNLSTARSVTRAKEIGVRKVIGAVKASLMKQFYIEALLFTTISVLIALLLLKLFLPQFNFITGKSIPTPFTNGAFWAGIATLTLVTGLISGSYPALLLSSFKPIAILKNNIRVRSSGAFRKGLVVFQFSLSMIFIIAMIVTSRQLNFIQNKNIGYEKTNLIYLPITGTMTQGYNSFKNEALKVSGVSDVSFITQRPMEIDNSTNDVKWEGKSPDDKVKFTQAAVGYDFIRTMQSQLLLGRDFSEEFSDSASYIINETALKAIGYKGPIGMPLSLWGIEGQIIGVMKDFHFNSLYVPINPLVLRLKKKRPNGYMLIRTEAGQTATALAGLETLHDRLNPEFVFAHQFADEEYGAMYASEGVIKELSKYVATFAIFISCLGLLGLVIFTSEQRTKEVGIRKVLGASVPQIVGVLSKDFLALVILSSLIASPVAYYLMNDWLNAFEYRIGIQWWFFALASGGALVIALLTISFQSVKTATENPVKSLRSE